MPWLIQRRDVVRVLLGILFAACIAAGARGQGVDLSNLPPHPRYFLTASRLAEVRTEVQSGQRKYDMFREIKRRADATMPLASTGSIDKIMCVLFTGLVNNDQSYVDRARYFVMKNVKTNQWPSEETLWHIAYDWLYPYMTSAQRDSCRNLSMTRYDTGNQRTCYYNLESNEATWGGLAGLTFYGEGNATQNAFCQELVDEWDGRMRGVREFRQPGGNAASRGGVLPTRQYYFPDGGYYKGNHYGQKDIETNTLYLALFQDLGLGNYWDICDSYMDNWAEYLMWMKRPDNQAQRLMSGVQYSFEYRGFVGLAILAHYRGSGIAAWILDNQTWAIGGSGGETWSLLCTLWRPNVPEVDPTATLPLYKFYGGAGENHVEGTTYSEKVICRSGWHTNTDNDDVYFTLHAGDYFGDYYNFTNLAFELYYRGALAIRGGYYMDDPNRANYYNRAVSTNTVVVLDNSQAKLPDKWGQDYLYDNPGRPAHIYDVGDGTPYDTADILAFEPGTAEAGPFYYVKGKLKPNAAYYYTKNTRKVTTQQREAVLYGHYLVVRDKVILSAAGNSVRFLLHTIHEPTIESGAQTGETVPGHITSYTRGRYSATRVGTVDQWTYNGKLTCQVVLPASATMRKVGGDGYECWVDNGSGTGQNYPLPTNLYTDRNEAGAWRMETIAPSGTNIDFVHALWVGKPNETMAAVTAIDEPNSIGCEVTGVGAFVFGRSESEQNSIQYHLTGESLGPLPNIVNGLEPNMAYAVYKGDPTPLVAKATSSGGLEFTTEGPVEVRIEPVPVASTVP